MSKHKNRNYVNYYAKSTYETTNDTSLNKEIKDLEHTKTLFDDIPEEPEVEEEVQEVESENPPEEEIQETRPVVEAPPEFVELLTNVYIRETPYGDKVPKDELDRIIASKVLADKNGDAIVPKGTKVQIYDMFVHKDGSIWFNTRFGYLMAKNKHGQKYIE